MHNSSCFTARKMQHKLCKCWVRFAKLSIKGDLWTMLLFRNQPRLWEKNCGRDVSKHTYESWNTHTPSLKHLGDHELFWWSCERFFVSKAANFVIHISRKIQPSYQNCNANRNIKLFVRPQASAHTQVKSFLLDLFSEFQKRKLDTPIIIETLCMSIVIYLILI